MYKINIYVSERQDHIDFSDVNLDLENDKIQVVLHGKENIYENLKNLDLYINFNGHFSPDWGDILFDNKVFINNFYIKNFLLGNSHFDNRNIFPYFFVITQHSKMEIRQKLEIYKILYDKNNIDSDYGKELWIVKSLNTYNSFDTLLLTNEELINYNNNYLYISKYLEKSDIIKKRYIVVSHCFIYPKIKKINDEYQIIRDDNNNYQYKMFLYDYIMITDDFNNVDNNNIYEKNIKIVQYTEYKHIKDDDIKKMVINKLKELNKYDDFVNGVKNSIYSYPYFGKIININFIINNKKNNIYIDSINTKPGLYYDEIKKSNLLTTYYQKIIKYILKIKHNKLIKYKTRYTKDLILI